MTPAVTLGTSPSPGRSAVGRGRRTRAALTGVLLTVAVATSACAAAGNKTTVLRLRSANPLTSDLYVRIRGPAGAVHYLARGLTAGAFGDETGGAFVPPGARRRRACTLSHRISVRRPEPAGLARQEGDGRGLRRRGLRHHLLPRPRRRHLPLAPLTIPRRREEAAPRLLPADLGRGQLKNVPLNCRPLITPVVPAAWSPSAITQAPVTLALPSAACTAVHDRYVLPLSIAQAKSIPLRPELDG